MLVSGQWPDKMWTTSSKINTVRRAFSQTSLPSTVDNTPVHYQLVMISLINPTPLALAAAVVAKYDVETFTVNVSSDQVSHLKSLVQLTHLPSGYEFSGSDATLGIPRDDLQSLQNEWVNQFDWQEQQSQLNKYGCYRVS
jgi:hypothetical protein